MAKRVPQTTAAATSADDSRSTLPAAHGRNSVTDTSDMVERLEELAAWHRMRAERAGSDWVWEARVRAAEDLERRAAGLRAQRVQRGRNPAGAPVAKQWKTPLEAVAKRDSSWWRLP